MVEILKETLLLVGITSPIWVFILIILMEGLKKTLEECKIYKKYYKKIDDMIFFYNVKGIPFSNNFINSLEYVETNYYENQWKIVINTHVKNYNLNLGANPFKNYWYNKFVNKISKKKIYSYVDYYENRNSVIKLEERNKKLNKILNS